MTVVRLPARKGIHRFLMEVKQWTREHRHMPPWLQQRVLASKLRGLYQYFGLPYCGKRLRGVREQVFRYWQWALGARSQRGVTWEWLRRRRWFQLPLPQVIHQRV